MTLHPLQTQSQTPSLITASPKPPVALSDKTAVASQPPSVLATDSLETTVSTPPSPQQLIDALETIQSEAQEHADALEKSWEKTLDGNLISRGFNQLLNQLNGNQDSTQMALDKTILYYRETLPQAVDKVLEKLANSSGSYAEFEAEMTRVYDLLAQGKDLDKELNDKLGNLKLSNKFWSGTTADVLTSLLVTSAVAYGAKRFGLPINYKTILGTAVVGGATGIGMHNLLDNQYEGGKESLARFLTSGLASASLVVISSGKFTSPKQVLGTQVITGGVIASSSTLAREGQNGFQEGWAKRVGMAAAIGVTAGAVTGSMGPKLMSFVPQQINNPLAQTALKIGSGAMMGSMGALSASVLMEQMSGFQDGWQTRMKRQVLGGALAGGILSLAPDIQSKAPQTAKPTEKTKPVENNKPTLDKKPKTDADIPDNVLTLDHPKLQKLEKALQYHRMAYGDGDPPPVTILKEDGTPYNAPPNYGYGTTPTKHGYPPGTILKADGTPYNLPPGYVQPIKPILKADGTPYAPSTPGAGYPLPSQPVVDPPDPLPPQPIVDGPDPLPPPPQTGNGYADPPDYMPPPPQTGNGYNDPYGGGYGSGYGQGTGYGSGYGQMPPPPPYPAPGGSYPAPPASVGPPVANPQPVYPPGTILRADGTPYNLPPGYGITPPPALIKPDGTPLNPIPNPNGVGVPGMGYGTAKPVLYDADGTPLNQVVMPKPILDEFGDPIYPGMKDHYYGKIFGDKALQDKTVKTIGEWTSTYSDGNNQTQMREAWKNIMSGKKPNTPLEKTVYDIYTTRRSRWERLADVMGTEVPEFFQLFRGTHSTRYVKAVVEAWKDPSSDMMQMPLRELSSWSLSEDAAKSFASDPNHSVLFEAQVPFEQTLADKFVDDGSFITSFNGENEVVVAVPEQNSLAIPKENATVTFQGKTFGYEQRAELIQLWEQHLQQPMNPVAPPAGYLPPNLPPVPDIQPIPPVPNPTAPPPSPSVPGAPAQPVTPSNPATQVASGGAPPNG